MENLQKIRAVGFMDTFLKKQINGLTGHMEEAGFPFDRVEWGKQDYVAENGGNPGWWVYEQTAYWVDGFTRAAILLEDEALLKKARGIIYDVINSADEDGYLGPKFLKPQSSWNRWPHVVFFRACMAYYDYSNDQKILSALEKHYLNDHAIYSDGRNVINVEILLWLYSKTGNVKLLEMAEKNYLEYNEKCENDLCDKVALSDKKPYAHGVSYNEYSKLGAILYSYTKKAEYLKASVAAYDKIDKYFMLIDGCHCSDEFLISNDVMHSHETCCITDYSWALNYLFEATGNTEYLDKIEKCVFNAGLGAIRRDFKSLQYFSCVNQVLADYRSNHNDFFKGSKWMSYRPNPGTECCAGNVNRFMPNYILNSWKREGQDVYLKLYAGTNFKSEDIEIEEDTDYPFVESAKLSIKTKVPFVLHLRLPLWNKGYNVLLNGKDASTNEQDGFATLKIRKDCVVEISFKSKMLIHDEGDYVWFSKGAVVYTAQVMYKLEVDKNEEKQSKEFPAYNTYPMSKWNYGVKKELRLRKGNAGTFTIDAYEIPDWKTEKTTKVSRCVNLYDKVNVDFEGDFEFTPPLPKNPTPGAKTRLRLVPYGSSILRITAFPKVEE